MRRAYVRWGVGATIAVVLAPIAVYILVNLVPGTGGFVVLSDSMAPSISSGAVVYVFDTGDYETGDVVTFTTDDRTVTHRIFETTAAGYHTKGDANDVRDDGVVTERQIVGEVLFSVPGYGTAILTARQHLFLLVAAAGGLLSLLGASLLRREPATDPD
jgi:signal peptidase